MRTDLVNGVLLVGVLSASVLGTLWVGGGAPSASRAEESAPVSLPGPPSAEFVDARGRKVPVRAYSKVASLNVVADRILVEIVPRSRIAGVSPYLPDEDAEWWRFEGLERVPSTREVERILALEPDLLIVSQLVDEGFVARLREVGVGVFDLGEMRGVETTREAIRTLSSLLEVPERGETLLERFDRELSALERAIPDEHVLDGIYLGVYGDSFFGGTSGSSSADVLRYGGVRDVAAAKGYTGWPGYSPEELLVMDPPLIVTAWGMARKVCGHPELRRLTACGPDGRVVELPEGTPGDPGLGVIEAARAVQRLVHGDGP